MGIAVSSTETYNVDLVSPKTLAFYEVWFICPVLPRQKPRDYNVKAVGIDNAGPYNFY